MDLGKLSQIIEEEKDPELKVIRQLLLHAAGAEPGKEMWTIVKEAFEGLWALCEERYRF